MSKNYSGIMIASLLVLGFVYLVYVFDRLVVAITLLEIRKAFSLDLSQAGFLATVFTLGITLGAIPSGYLIARWGAKPMLVAGAVAFSACTAWSAFASNFAWMTASRVGGGLGEALYNVALFTFLSSGTSRYKGAAAGFPATIFGVGVFLGPIVISGLLARMGYWQGPFLVLSGIGLVGALLLAIVLPSSGKQRVAEPPVDAAASGRWGRVLSPNTLAILAVVAVNGMAIYSFIALFHTFLRDDRHLDVEVAGFIVSAFGIGQLVGGAPMGFLADTIGRRPYLSVAALATGLAGAFVFSEQSQLASAALAFVFGVGTNSIYTNCIALAQERSRREDVPLVTGVLASVYFLTAAFSGWVLASLQASFGWQTAGVVIYLVPFLLVALLIFFQIKPAADERATP